MENKETLNRILKEFDKFEKLKQSQEVLVMHFSCMDLCRDYITHRNNSVIFNNKIEIYFTSYLPKFNFVVMTRLECETFEKNNNMNNGTNTN
jgi:hypothetical protein